MATGIFIYSWSLKWQTRNLHVRKGLFASQYLQGEWWHKEETIQLPLFPTPVQYQDFSATTVWSSPVPCPGCWVDGRLQPCSLPQCKWGWWTWVMLLLDLWVMMWRRPAGAEGLSGCLPSSALSGRHPWWILTGGNGFPSSTWSPYT